MKNLTNKIGITLYEYSCTNTKCNKFFWVSKNPTETLNCPYCKNKTYINGEIPIKEIKLYEKNKINKK